MAASAATAATPVEPTKPKRPQSAYFLFANELREQVTKELKERGEGKFKFGDVAKEISSRWAALSDEEKKPYEERAAADKQRHAEEFRAYLEASDPAGTLRRRYEHLMPRRPTAAAARFQQDAAVRAKAEAQLKEAGQEAGPRQVDAKVKEMWKHAGEEVRRPFEEQAAKDKVDFFLKQKEWQATAEFKEIEAAERLQAARTRDTEPEGEGAKTPAKRAKKGERLAAETPTSKGPEAKRRQPEQPRRDAAPAAKRGRRSGQKAAAEAGVHIDAEVLREAATLKMEAALRNLAGRPEIAALGKRPSELLDALRASGGLVNPAKRALLGEA